MTNGAQSTNPGVPVAPPHGGRSLVRMVTGDRAARWTSRLVLLALWQAAGAVSIRFPTPVRTVQILVTEFNAPFRGGPWSVWNNELVQNLGVSIQRTVLAILLIIAIGLPVGYAMGSWWRAQALLTDLVTVGIAMPAYMWALLAIMWFGFGIRAPVFCAVVSATPGLVIHVLQGTLAVPQDLRDMSEAYDVPLVTRLRHLVLPSMAAAVLAGLRVTIIAAWGCVILVEWFGSNEGAGFRARDWYQSAADYNGLMAWGVVILTIVIAVDRGLVERIDRAAHRWRGAIGGFGAGARRTQRV
jgi:ABC-type nitrate/sulfonate/bicarbonate transport system permease component